MLGLQYLFISIETTVLRNRAGTNVQMFNKPKKESKNQTKSVVKQKKSLCEMSGDDFFRCDSICRIAHVCLSVGLPF
mgnify:FL=1